MDLVDTYMFPYRTEKLQCYIEGSIPASIWYIYITMWLYSFTCQYKAGENLGMYLNIGTGLLVIFLASE